MAIKATLTIVDTPGKNCSLNILTPHTNTRWELCQYLVLVSEGVLPSFFEL